MTSLPQLYKASARGILRLPQVRSRIPTPLLQTTSPYHLLGPSKFGPTPVSTFSTRAVLLKTNDTIKGPSKPRPDARNTETEHEDPLITPSVSLESLGIGKNMKIFLLVVLSIFGTIETWFWCKAIWIWWKGGESEETE